MGFKSGTMLDALKPRGLWAVTMGCVCVLALHGCAQTPKNDSGTDMKPPSSGASPTAPPGGTPPPSLPPQPPQPPEPTMTTAEIRQAMDSVRLQLDQGQEEPALEVVQRVLRSDPNNKLAASYLKQIKDDPQALYGNESTAYRVAPGETLAAIASRAFKDRDQFYGLARYNGIKVPRQVQAGQTIRVPGKAVLAPAASTQSTAPTAASTASTPPTPSQPPSPPQAAQPTTPPSTPPTAVTAPATQPEAVPAPAVPVVDDKQKQIAQCQREARRAQAQQDLCTAIDRWTCVLLIDPAHKTALYERDRSIELKKKLPNAPC